MTFGEVGEFLSRLFFTGLTDVTVEAFFVDVLMMSLFLGAVIFLVTVILLSSRFYRSDPVRLLLDTDGRIKICAGWATLTVFFVLLFVLFWIWYWALIPIPLDFSFWTYQKPLVAHWTVLVLLFVVWLLLYRSVREDIKRAQMTIPPG